MSFRWGVAVLFVLSTAAFAQDRPTVRAVRVQGTILIDGELTESVWGGPAFTAFRQRDPQQGAEPTERTEVWVAYDDEALYVAARLHDSAPDSINTRLGRRDDFMDTDYFAVYIDGYHDRQTGNFFTVSAAGVQYDGVMFNDDWDDNTWDGVWDSETHLTNDGWTAELRIPYSQLRFHEAADQVWGINFRRDISRRNERDWLAYTPRQESGFVSRFADLVGIDAIHPPRRLAVLPYVTTKAEYAPAVPGNPFHDGSRYLPGTGVDVQAGFGSNLTLNATVNPDFGQVEVDPAVINISDVETFYEEKRPFFVEGANTFWFGQGGSNDFWGFNWGNPDIFYSRRIGRTPQGSLPAYDYADAPAGTHILGAGKLTGRLDEQTTFGMIHAVTNREFTRIQSAGVRSNVEVEPLTYYGIARAQRNFDDRRYGLGAITTLTHRFFADQLLAGQLNRDAYVGGVDGWAFLDADRVFVATGWVSGSMVQGTAERMLSLQRSSAHYFQRPDASQVHVDSSATSLSGYASRFTLNKQKGPVIFNAAFGLISPGYEINDLGFQFRTDYMNGHIVSGYRFSEPTSWYRSINVRASYFQSLDFAGNTTWRGYWMNTQATWLNYWQMFVGTAYNPPTLNARRTRGGPLTLNPSGVEVFGGFNTDTRNLVVFDLMGDNYNGQGGRNYFLEAGVEFKPASGLTLKVGPSFSEELGSAQWVDAYDDPTATSTFGRQYVAADFHQRTFSANIRLNWIFSPHLSLQMFVQPLISSGEYSRYKRLARPGTFDYEPYGTGSSTVQEQTASDGSVTYTVDGDGAGVAPSYTFSNPDFNFRSIRGNAVLRWEYRPGSTLYFVWTQSREDYEQVGRFEFNRSLSRLASAKPDNIFLVKFTYWWNM